MVDLHAACLDTLGSGAQTIDGDFAVRLAALVDALPPCALVDLGGFPIVLEGQELRWNDGPATAERLRTSVIAALGSSAVLTYLNPRGRTLGELGAMCAQRRHLWAYNWLTAGIVLSGVSLEAELAFARDARFFLSWPVPPTSSDRRVFVAHGTLKAWTRFVARRDDDSFHPDARQAMAAAAEVLGRFVPERAP